MKNKVKNKNIIVYAVISVILIALIIATAVICTKILNKEKDYLIFSVTDSNNNMVNSSIKNALTFDTTYTFDINYIFAQEESNNKVYEYTAKIVGAVSIPLKNGEKDINFKFLDVSNAFKLEKKDKQFSITIPPADKFLEMVFSEYTDINNKDVYLSDLSEIDYFSLNIVSYNNKDNINFKFHIVNKDNEIVDIDEIVVNESFIDFSNGYSPNFNIDIDKIVIESSGKIDFWG